MAGFLNLRVSLIKGGVEKYGIVNPIFQPSPVDPLYRQHLIFGGISVDDAGKQYCLDPHVADRRACLNAIEDRKKFGFTGEQAYAILGTAPVEGRISGIVEASAPYFAEKEPPSLDARALNRMTWRAVAARSVDGFWD